MVFTARDPHAHFNGSPYHQYYSDYKVCDEQGNLLQTIHNDSGTYVDGPAEVKLPAGKYRVLARASGSREVAVPVIIASHQVTTVHLDSVGTAASN
ncbi:MAG TPA: hypothetical protein VLT36_01725 [Candidatus Dormibacteraeota bacterium]|nr:hypothetical protein [Candidatus Dormibacteraeota bacterium]